VNRLGRTFFAEVVGLDLSQPLDDATFARVKQAHLEHGVLVLRDQHLTPEQHIAFSARFGPLQVHPMGQFNLEGAPQILLVSNDKHPDGRPVGIADAGRYWHTDMSDMKEPALGSLLYARAIPVEGGDTMFCDMTAACRDLPPDMRRKLVQWVTQEKYVYVTAGSCTNSCSGTTAASCTTPRIIRSTCGGTCTAQR
jgi:taurine dioxygenase